MSDLTVKAFVDLEKSNFENFNGVLASRIEEAWTRALVEFMRTVLKSKDHAELTLPWGTYSADNVAKGEAGNIAPKWEPAKGFLKVLNDDISDQGDRAAVLNQDEFDPNFLKLFKDFVAYGFFYPDAPENKDRTAKNKGIRLSDDEADFFLNEYALMLANLAKDKQREGKIFRLEINNSYPHGCFDFEYDDDDIKVRWTADKIFKQCLKDDEAAAKADVNDFTPIQEGETRKQTIALN